MREILTDKMLHEIFKALEKGEQYEYSDANTQISINPHGISIQYKSSTDTREVEDFLRYCDNLDDELDYELEECFNEFENSKIDLTNKIIQLDNEYKPSFLLSYTLDELKKLLHKLEQRRLKK